MLGSVYAHLSMTANGRETLSQLFANNGSTAAAKENTSNTEACQRFGRKGSG